MEQNKQKRTPIVRLLRAVLIAALVCILAIAAVNIYMIRTTDDRIVDLAGAQEQSADCILILGAGVRADGRPSFMLEDRLLTGIELYQAGIADKILVSGDHGQVEYDEVNVMKQFLLAAGIPDEDIFMDHAGFSTYESMYRARAIFRVETAVVVTQKYHQYRSLYLAETFDIEAVGVSADRRAYRGQAYRELREIAARAKDCLNALIRPEPTYLGEAIPISGSGVLTNDHDI